MSVTNSPLTANSKYGAVAVVAVLGLHILAGWALLHMTFPELLQDKPEQPPIEITLIEPPKEEEPPPVELEVKEEPQPVEVEPVRKQQAKPVAQPQRTRTPPKTKPPTQTKSTTSEPKPDKTDEQPPEGGQTGKPTSTMPRGGAVVSSTTTVSKSITSNSPNSGNTAYGGGDAVVKNSDDGGGVGVKTGDGSGTVKTPKDPPADPGPKTSPPAVDFPSSAASWKSKPRTEFPESALRGLTPGQVYSVSLTLVVDKNGKITNATINGTSGNNDINRAALRQVKTGKLTPFTKNGSAVEGRVNIVLEYQVPSRR